MERIELFDQYILGKLSANEVSDFKKRLEADDDFAAEFRIYLISVKGICQEVEQANIEFGYAMKSLTEAQLQSIIGKSEKPRTVRLNAFRERVMWISSMAAVIMVAIAIGWNLYTTSRHQRLADDAHLCEVIYSYEYRPIEGDRGDGGEYVNLNSLTDDQVERLIPKMTSAFETDETDSQAWHIDGTNLAMAYLKLHRRDDAVRVLKDMAAKTAEPERYNRLIEILK